MVADEGLSESGGGTYVPVSELMVMLAGGWTGWTVTV